MTIILPQPNDYLADKHHPKMHRVFAIDENAPDETVVANADGSISLNEMNNRVANAILGLNTTFDRIEYKDLIAGDGIDIIHTANAIEIRASSYSQIFIVGDWILNGDNYEIVISHNLDSTNTIIEIRQGTDIIFVNRVENIDSNSIKISVPADPDLRFNGRIKILK